MLIHCVTDPGPKGPERDGSTNDIIRASMNKIGMIPGDEVRYFP